MNMSGCLSLTQIRGYNSRRRPCITGKLKGHKFIGICQQVEIDKNNTCLILSVLCKNSEYINLSGSPESKAWRFVSTGFFWAALWLKKEALVRVKTRLGWCMMYEPSQTTSSSSSSSFFPPTSSPFHLEKLHLSSNRWLAFYFSRALLMWRSNQGQL